jgi:hypothetical protein
LKKSTYRCMLFDCASAGVASPIANADMIKEWISSRLPMASLARPPKEFEFKESVVRIEIDQKL